MTPRDLQALSNMRQRLLAEYGRLDKLTQKYYGEYAKLAPRSKRTWEGDELIQTAVTMMEMKMALNTITEQMLQFIEGPTPSFQEEGATP